MQIPSASNPLDSECLKAMFMKEAAARIKINKLPETGAAGNMSKIYQQIVESIPIPFPPLATQQAIVAEIEAEHAPVAANRELIALFEKKIEATLARVWGEETPAVSEAMP